MASANLQLVLPTTNAILNYNKEKEKCKLNTKELEGLLSEVKEMQEFMKKYHKQNEAQMQAHSNLAQERYMKNLISINWEGITLNEIRITLHNVLDLTIRNL